jgi:hypothetical protein
MYDYGILRFQGWEFSQGAYNAIGICSALHNIIGTKDVRYMLALKTGRSPAQSWPSRRVWRR